MSMREAGAGTNNYSLAHMREKSLSNVENEMDNYMQQGGNAWDAQSFGGKFGKKGEQNRDEYFEKDDEGYFKLKDGYEQRSLGKSDARNGAEMVYSNDYDDLESPEDARYYGIYKTSGSSENDPSPTDPPLAPNSLAQNAQQFIERNKQTDTPDYNTSSQEFLDSYIQNGTAPNNVEGEQFSANLNSDLPNNVDTTDNNNFANGTFDPVNKAGEAAQNFLANKKNLVLTKFK